jgi:hypothetical protein
MPMGYCSMCGRVWSGKTCPVHGGPLVTVGRNLQDVLKVDWLKSADPLLINSTDQLSMLWAQFGPGGPFDINVQSLLSAAIQNAFGVDVAPATFNGTMTFAQLAQLIGADGSSQV